MQPEHRDLIALITATMNQVIERDYDRETISDLPHEDYSQLCRTIYTEAKTALAKSDLVDVGYPTYFNCKRIVNQTFLQ